MRGREIAADRMHGASKHSPPFDDVEDREQDEENDDRNGQQADMAAPERKEGRAVGDIDVVLVGEDIDEPTADIERRERRDECIDAEAGDDRAVDEADDETGEHARGGGDNGLAPGFRMTIAATMPPRPSTRSNRDIDPASEDHQGLADRHDAYNRRLAAGY